MDGTESKINNDIQWHPAFVVALQALLIDYKDDLDYRLEHPLTTGSLSIDMLVIKKRPDVVIKRQIAEIFRLDNIVEYKSPTDYLSVREFHKSFARLHLYAALTEGADVTGLTLSFVVASYPRELFRHLRETLGYGVEERHPGVFVVAGAMIPIQIIHTVKLSEEENLWLRNLNRDLSEENLLWAHGVGREYSSRLDLNAWLQAVFAANHKAIEEIFSKEEKRMLTAEFCETIEKIGLGEKWRQEGRLETAQVLFTEGFTIENIARITRLPLEMLKEKLAPQRPSEEKES